MAKISITANVPDGQIFYYPFDQPLFVKTHSTTTWRLSEKNDGSDYVIIHGKNLGYYQDKLVSGTITDMEFLDKNGDEYLTAKNIDVDIHNDVEMGHTFINTIFDLASVSNDKVVGTKENDVLYGGAGKNVLIGYNGNDTLLSGSSKDTMTGNSGSDTFCFSYFTKNTVVVTDFDAVGGKLNQDYFYFNHDFLDARILRHGEDTVLDFGEHRTMTLVDVDRSDVTMADFREMGVF